MGKPQNEERRLDEAPVDCLKLLVGETFKRPKIVIVSTDPESLSSVSVGVLGRVRHEIGGPRGLATLSFQC